MRAVWIMALLGAGCFSKPDRPGSEVDASVDAGPDLCDPAKCTAAKGVCTSGTCVIDGGQAAVMCPAGMPCHVICAQNDDCDYVRCLDATTCDVECTGMKTCEFGVGCDNAATCNIECDGMSTCMGSPNLPAIGCGDSQCDVTCNGKDACKNGIDTNGGSCTASCCGSGACNGGTDTCTRDAICD